MDLVSGVQKQILSVQTSAQNPAGSRLSVEDLSLSPDGRTLAVMVVSKVPRSGLLAYDGQQIYRVGIDGDGYRRLADSGNPGVSVMSWSNDGSVLYLEGIKPTLMNIPRDGNDPEVRPVHPRCGFWDDQINCSPDGRHMIKESVDYNELWEMDNVPAFLAKRP